MNRNEGLAVRLRPRDRDVLELERLPHADVPAQDGDDRLEVLPGTASR